MVPFLVDACSCRCSPHFMKMKVKPDALEQVNSGVKLFKLDLSNFENLLPCELMRLPAATKSSLRSADPSNVKK